MVTFPAYEVALWNNRLTFLYVNYIDVAINILVADTFYSVA